MSHVHKTMKSPVGELTLIGDDRGLAAILWENDDPLRVRIEPGAEDPGHPVLVETERQLGEYFAGARKVFSVPLAFAGTPFQQQVWRALLDIPFGETRSYADLARRIGRPKAVRAVGAANGKNPISIIGPCHRVIGSSGRLTGYAGGLAAKALLLRLEGCPTPVPPATGDQLVPGLHVDVRPGALSDGVSVEFTTGRAVRTETRNDPLCENALKSTIPVVNRVM